MVDNKECCGSADCECNHEEELETIILTSDDGSEVEAVALGTFDIEDVTYIALQIINAGEDEEEIIFFIIKDDQDPENAVLEPIESDEDYDMVADTFYALIESDEAIEELEE